MEQTNSAGGGAASQALLTGVGNLLSQSWSFFRGNFTSLAGIYTVPFAAFVVLSFFYTGTGGAVDNIADFILSATTALASLAVIYSIKDTSGISGSYKSATRHFLKYAWVGILIWLIAMGGFVMLVIPGLLFIAWFMFAPFVFVFEEKRGFEALLKSKEYVKDYFWPVVGRVLSWVLIVVLLSLPITAIIGFSGGGNTAALNIAALIWAAISMLVISPISMVYGSNIYKDLSRVKPGVASGPVDDSKKGFFIFAAILGVLVPFIMGVLIGAMIGIQEAARQATQGQIPY